MKRRKFLQLIGGGVVLAAGSATLFASTRTPTRALEPWKEAGSAQYQDPRLHALSYAILAPNPHNRQPWTVELIGDDAIRIGVDPERQLPATDPFDRQLTIGMGCFLELLEMAANDTGFRVETALFPEGADTTELTARPVADVRFVADSAVITDPLFAHVLERRSNKEVYDMTRPVPREALATLAGSAINGTTFGGTVEADEISYWRGMTETAMALETDTPYTFKESVELFRVGKRQINANPDGIELPGAMMDIMAATGMMAPEIVMDQTSIAFQQGRESVLEPLRTSMGFVWSVTQDNDRPAQIAAGRDWLRINLAATSIGLAFHPNSQLLQEYPEMAALYKDVHQRLAPSGGTVQMLSRIGYAAPVGPTPRWPLETRIVA